MPDARSRAALIRRAGASDITSWIGFWAALLILTLLCRYHHTHFLQKGWTCRINTDGLPEWIPPRWIDQDQRPK
jgi:hypothetical protein